MLKKKMNGSQVVYFWVATTNPFNSIYIQIQLTANILRNKFDVETIILHPDIINIKSKLKELLKSNEIIFWHYGGFDKYLNVFKIRRNLIFVYHNITPAFFFWKSDPLISIRSLLGRIQLRLINKSSRWITMSPYNISELKKWGFKEVLLCPNIISPTKIDAVQKTKNISLLYVGRISPNKNCVSLLEQIELVSNKMKKPIELTIVGTSKIGCRHGEEFSNKLLQLKSNEFLKVIWEKNVEINRLSHLYQQSWLYVTTSLHEGFGVPACESIAYGTPALYLQCGGQESILNNLGMVPLNQKDNFANYVIDLLNDDNKRLKLVQEQKEIVKYYISPRIEKLICEVYSKII